MFFEDLKSAQDRVISAQAELDAAKAALVTLQASAVKGGPDVSEFQPNVDWAALRGDGYELAFVRASDGDRADLSYTRARVGAVRQAGLVLAAYHYARVASAGNFERTPATEAAMAYYLASRHGWGVAGDLPLAYDVEKNAGETATFQGQPAAKAAAHVAGFVQAYHSLAGHWPIVYTNPSTWSLLGPQLTATQAGALAQCPLWVAHWGVASPTVPAPWSSWTFWQYTNAGTVAGVTGNVDLNRFSGSRTELDGLRI